MKPTTITVNITHYDSNTESFYETHETAVLTSIEGHDVYVLESAINGVESDYALRFNPNTSNVFRENGERVMCAWTFGRTGKSLRWACVIVNAKTKQIMRTTNGMNGATGHGHGASLRFIDWDGSKYADAIETAKRTGKKLLRAY